MRTLHATDHQANAPQADVAAGRAVEWPTVLIALTIYAAFAALTWFYHELPWWLTLPAAAYLVAWHGSLQHEAIHRHPTRWPLLNELIAFPNLWLWMPYRVYRDTHLTHHRDQRLTDPVDDPESYYKTANEWARYSRWTRGVLWIHNTVAGRLTFGPPLALWQLWKTQLPRLLRGERDPWIAWTLHALSCALVLAWVVWVCRIPIASYVLLFAYPGTALTMLRSFLEHQAAPAPERRSVIVDTAWPMALLYLNNNLHALHHREPWLPWYRLPRRYREQRDAILASNGGYRFSGYAEIIARYLLWPKEAPLYPPSHHAPERGIHVVGALASQMRTVAMSTAVNPGSRRSQMG